MQLFCADSIDGEAVTATSVRRRAEMEEKYFVHLPPIGFGAGPERARRCCCGVWASTCAVHAVNCRLRRPSKLFAGAIGLSGIYDLARFWGSEADLAPRALLSPAVFGENGIAGQAGSGQSQGEQPDALRRVRVPTRTMPG